MTGHCPPHLNAWTDEDRVLLADLHAAGISPADIASRLRRSENAVRLKICRSVACPVDGNVPGWGKRPWGSAKGKPYWTRERTLAGLQDFAQKHRGLLPTSDHTYNSLKKGHMEWPTSQSILAYFGSMARAWEAAGISRRRFNMGYAEWSDEENDYLLEHAGEETLKIIGAHLGRSWSACKRRLYDLKAGRARDVPGYLSAMQVAREYHCPLSRVHTLIATGELPAFKVKGGHYWRVNPIDIKGDLERKLRAPKRRSYKTSPPDVGDYYQRYNIRRLMVGGVVTRVTVTVVSGCKRCGGNLYLDEDELKCLQCGRQPGARRRHVLMMPERALHGPRRTCTACRGPLSRQEIALRRLRCADCSLVEAVS